MFGGEAGPGRVSDMPRVSQSGDRRGFQNQTGHALSFLLAFLN